VPEATLPNHATLLPLGGSLCGAGSAPESFRESVTRVGFISGLLMLTFCGFVRICQKGAPGPAAASPVHVGLAGFSKPSATGPLAVSILTLSIATPRKPW
jgi:hypothetical protein